MTTDFDLDITVKEKPVLGINDLLLLLNYHCERDTSTFPTERYRVQFALILLLLFSTGCRPAELVNAKKKKRRTVGLDNDDTCADDMSDEDFAEADADFGFDGDDDDDSAVADLDSENGNDNDDDNDNDNHGSDEGISMSDAQTEVRQFDALCYEDVRLLVVRNPVVGERDVLAMEVKLAHHKGAKRRPKP